MKALLSVLVIFAATIGTLVAAAAIWFFLAWDHASLRYKLTYVVDVNGEKRTGSGVIQIRSEDTSKLPLPGRGFGASATGEAVVVDLGDGRYLFSLLNNAATLPFKPFIDYYKDNNTSVDVTRALDADKPSIELTSDQLPMLVTFTNVDNPKSVREVDPDNLAESFGPGVHLESATLEITNAPVTQGQVEVLLEWFTEYQKNIYRLNGARCVACPVESEKLADLLGASAFKIGE